MAHQAKLRIILTLLHLYRHAATTVLLYISLNH